MLIDLPRPLVLATGVFDLLHTEHVFLLEVARAQGASLVVGVNSDASVRRLNKGPGRPIIKAAHRAALVSALRCVDLVRIFHEDTPLELIERLRPDVLVKGHDYAHKPVVGQAEVESWGGRVHIVPTTNRISTSRIIEHIQELPYTPAPTGAPTPAR